MIPWTHMSQCPKRHLDEFSNFCKHIPMWPIDRQTDRQTVVRAISVAVSVYSVHTKRLNNNDNNDWWCCPYLRKIELYMFEVSGVVVEALLKRALHEVMCYRCVIKVLTPGEHLQLPHQLCLAWVGMHELFLIFIIVDCCKLPLRFLSFHACNSVYGILTCFVLHPGIFVL